MPSSSNLKSRFAAQYQGDIKDPILTTLLETLESYQEDIENKHLLSVYSLRSDDVSDGLFEVLRRHLFGQMFPGPAFVVLEAAIREPASAHSIRLDQPHYMSIQDQEGTKILFAPQYPVWITPSTSNEVRVETYGDDILLGFNVHLKFLEEVPDGSLSVYTGTLDPLLVERLRCRIPKSSGSPPGGSSPTVLRPNTAGNFTLVDEVFHTAYESRFLRIPYAALLEIGYGKSKDVVWIPFQGLASFADVLEKQLTANSFAAWNMVEEKSEAIPLGKYRYSVPIVDHTKKQTIVTRVTDLGHDTPIEYVDAATTPDPGYPFQFTTSVDLRGDEIVIATHPMPAGTLRVGFVQYDIGDNCVDIAAGRSFDLFKGIDERIKSLRSLTPTHRIHALNDKRYIWNCFRSLLASRNRWLTRDDLRIAIGSFPPFSQRNEMVKTGRILFEEKVGRVKGFLTPFTDITVPIDEPSLLMNPDRPHFERNLGQYLKSRTVNGNFVRVRLVSASET